MKITEEYQNQQIECLEIKSAIFIGDYSIRILFTDGYERIVNFKPFLTASLHPSIRKYLDDEIFKQFRIIDGNLNWNNYDLIFPIDDLYHETL